MSREIFPKQPIEDFVKEFHEKFLKKLPKKYLKQGWEDALGKSYYYNLYRRDFQSDTGSFPTWKE